MNQNPNTPPTEPRRAFSEELEVAGSQLVERVRELIEQGNVRRLIIRDQSNRTLLEIPLTVGVVATGALAIFYPLLAGLAAIGGLVARVKIEIVRDEPDATVTDAKQTINELTDEITGRDETTGV
ncbi:MAG: DUF4342 domain-containing protein [Blastochloris sp.]|nr:DUF4342 domain-containing protein [Blastochloris sp.]